jgi:hypothetical protein
MMAHRKAWILRTMIAGCRLLTIWTSEMVLPRSNPSMIGFELEKLLPMNVWKVELT